MADVKISALTAVVTPATTDEVPVVQGGVTKRETVAQIRTVIMPAVLTADVSGTLPVANGGTGITSLGAGVASFLGTPSSANLLAALTDETGTGAAVFANTPTLVAPVIGAATGTSVALGTAPRATNGTIKLPKASSAYFRDSTDASDMVAFLSDGSDQLFVGSDAAFGSRAMYTYGRAAIGFYIGVGAADVLAFSSTETKSLNPILGYGSVYGVHGVGSQAMADANQTPDASVYINGTIRTTGAITANRTLTLPGATDAAAYTKVINNTCTNAFGLIVGSGGANTVTVANGTSAVLLIDSRGVTRLTPDT